MLSALRRISVIAMILTAMTTPLLWAQVNFDVAVSKSGPATAAADTDVTYNVTVSSIGLNDATAVSLSDPIPAGMTFVSSSQDSGPSFSCSTPPFGAGGTITCTIATFVTGTSASFTFVFHIPPATPPGTVFVNIATVSTTPPDDDSENDSAPAATSTPPPPQGDLAISKSGPPAAGPDTDVAFTIGLTNAGPDPATSVSLQDALPGTMTFVSLTQNSGPTMSCTTGGTVTCTAASFAAGATASFTLTGHIPPATPSGTLFSNTATVSSSNDPNSENNVALADVIVSSADVAVTKSGPPTVTAGTNITYTVTVSNNGPDTANNLNLTDPLPPGTTFVSLNQDTGPAAVCVTPTAGTNGTVTCSFATLGSGISAQFTLVINAGSATSMTNTASVASDAFDTNTANNSSGVTTTAAPLADLSVTKSGPPSVTAGANVTYTVTVTNGGPTAAANVSLTDAIPANTTFVSANQTTGPAFSCATPAFGGTGTITCNLAAFAPAASATFSFVFNVSPAATGTITNTANVASTTTDPAAANNSAIATTPVNLITTDVGIVKTANGSAFGAGSTATFTIVVTNNGPNTAMGTTVTDVLPAGTTLTSATSTQGTCAGTSTVTCAVGTLAASASATITIAVTLPATLGPMSNTATVTISNADTNPANNSSTVAITVLASTAIPTLSPLALALLALTLAAVALFVQRVR